MREPMTVDTFVAVRKPDGSKVPGVIMQAGPVATFVLIGEGENKKTEMFDAADLLPLGQIPAPRVHEDPAVHMEMDTDLAAAFEKATFEAPAPAAA